jgi:hypothetical protein
MSILFDAEIKFSDISDLTVGGFREPELRAKLNGLDLKSLINEIGAENVLNLIDINEILSFIQENGFETKEL